MSPDDDLTEQELSEAVDVWGRKVWELAHEFAQHPQVAEVSVSLRPVRRSEVPTIELVVDERGVLWRTRGLLGRVEERAVVWSDGTLAREEGQGS
jgi:hypothetical protein